MGSEPAVGMANSVMAWVVGLISPIWLSELLGEPEVAVGARRDPVGQELPVGMGNSVMAWVVGLIIPIWLAHGRSVNQRLPSGPAVIPQGPELAVGMGNSVMAWVVGLIIPIWLAVELGEPEVAVGARRDPLGTGIGGGDGELGDGVGRRVDHPDLVGCRTR